MIYRQKKPNAPGVGITKTGERSDQRQVVLFYSDFVGVAPDRGYHASPPLLP